MANWDSTANERQQGPGAGAPPGDGESQAEGEDDLLMELQRMKNVAPRQGRQSQCPYEAEMHSA